MGKRTPRMTETGTETEMKMEMVPGSRISTWKGRMVPPVEQ